MWPWATEALDMIFQRMQKPAPEWLVKARRFAAFERPTGLTYINLQRLREDGPGVHRPRRKEWLELFGLAQSPWLVSASGLVGADVVTRTVLPIEGQPRGLLFPANGRGLKREDLAAIPDDATLALAVRLNVRETLDALAAAGKTADPEIKQSLLKGLETLKHGGDANSRAGYFRIAGRPLVLLQFTARGRTGDDRADRRRADHGSQAVFAELRGLDAVGHAEPAPDDGFGPNGQRIRRFRFAGGDVHYANPGRTRPGPGMVGGRPATRGRPGPAEHQGLSVARRKQPVVGRRAGGGRRAFRPRSLAGDRLSRCPAAVRIDLSALDHTPRRPTWVPAG